MGPEGTSEKVPRSFNDVLRHPSGTLVTPTSVTTIFLNVSRHGEMFLTCRQFVSSKCHGPTQGENHILARIDVDSGYGSILTGRMPFDSTLHVGHFAARQLNFALTGINGKPVKLHDDSLTFVIVIT